jgi:hypothetical protein
VSLQRAERYYQLCIAADAHGDSPTSCPMQVGHGTSGHLMTRLAAYARASLNKALICSQERASALAS